MSMPASIAAWMLCTAALFGASPVLAVDVFINNVKVTTAIRNQSLPKVDVRLDERGDVYITAPGYKVEQVGPPPSINAPASNLASSAQRPAGQYWVIVTVPTPNHYQIEVDANTKRVASIPPSATQYVVDISGNMLFGHNSVVVTFLPAANPPQTAPTDAVDVMIAQGSKGADNTITVSRVLGQLKRKTGIRAAEAQQMAFTLQ